MDDSNDYVPDWDQVKNWDAPQPKQPSYTTAY